jgi:hypothetical protein
LFVHDIESRQLKEPEHEIITVRAAESDEEAGRKVREVIAKISEGQYNKKVLLKIEDSEQHVLYS